jgi:hypothetical protein
MLLHRRSTPILLAAVLLSACVHWESVSPVDAPPRLPRWVRVTTRDSLQQLLQDAAFHHDTLVGRASSDAGATLARIPGDEIAHVEARVPSLSRSIGVAAVVLGAFVTFVYLVGHATTT